MRAEVGVKEAIAGSGSGSPCLKSSIQDEVESQRMKESSLRGGRERWQGVAAPVSQG